MRIFRYFTLLLLALLSLNVAAQGADSTKVKVTVVFEFGLEAGQEHYEIAKRKLKLYTFSPQQNGRDALKFLDEHGFSAKMRGGTFLEEIDLFDENRVSEVVESDYLQREKYAERNDTSSTVLGKKMEYTINVLSGASSFVVFCDYDALFGTEINENGQEEKVKKGGYFTSKTMRLHIWKNLIQTFEKQEQTDDLVIDDRPAEKPGVLIMNKNFVFPYKLRPNQRIVAQPVWYDRIDISDANSDTVFAYGKPVYLDCAEYALTQDRAMDYKMKNDKLYAYSDTAKYYKYAKLNVQRLDSLWVVVCDRLRNTSVVPNDNDDLLRVFPDDKNAFSRDAWVSLLDNKTSSDSLQSIYRTYLFSHEAPSSIALTKLLTDSIRTSIRISPTFDTIYVHAYEELRGHDPNTAHPYPQGLQLFVEDYNRVLQDFPEKDGGERKSPFKFLDFTFTEFLPDAEEFHLIMRSEEFGDSTEVRLQFEYNSPRLIPNDSLNEVEIVRLDTIFRAYRNDESRNLQTVSIVAYSSPEGNVEGNKDLARRRAETAKGLINTRARISVSSDVAPWDSVVSLLRRDGKYDVADYIQSVIDRYPGQLQKQSTEIQNRKDYYTTEFKDTYLAPLRTVKFRLEGTTIGQLPDHKIIEKYRDGLHGSFTRAEYWVLLNRLTNPMEHQQAAKLAYEKTRYPGKYKNHDGYWAYAAAHYAAGNIANGIYDHSILAPFLDMKNAIITVENDSSVPIPGRVDVVYYDVNKEDVAKVFVPNGENEYKAELEVYKSKTKEKHTIRISAADYKNMISLLNRNAVNGATYNLLGEEYPLFITDEGNNVITFQRNYKEPDKIKKYYKGQRIILSDKKSEKFNDKDNILYLNQIDMVANQLIMTLKTPESYWSQYLYELVEILKGQMVKYNDVITRRGEKLAYDRLLAVANCYIGNYAGSDPESVRLREIVASTSNKNRVIMNLAMDDPQVRGGKELDIAYSAARALPDTCPESNYLRAIINMRKYEADRERYPIDSAYNRLAKSFHGDLSMIYTASNDQDFLSRVAGVEMVDKALDRWEREKTVALDSVVSTLDDIAFRCYKEAIDETDTLKARLAMYKAFLLDDNYYNVAAVRMKGLQKKMLVKNDAENQLLFNKLKAIRRSYSEALEGKNDAIYIQALQEVKALRKNYK